MNAHVSRKARKGLLSKANGVIVDRREDPRAHASDTTEEVAGGITEPPYMIGPPDNPTIACDPSPFTVSNNPRIVNPHCWNKVAD